MVQVDGLGLLVEVLNDLLDFAGGEVVIESEDIVHHPCRRGIIHAEKDEELRRSSGAKTVLNADRGSDVRFDLCVKKVAGHLCGQDGATLGASENEIAPEDGIAIAVESKPFQKIIFRVLERNAELIRICQIHRTDMDEGAAGGGANQGFLKTSVRAFGIANTEDPTLLSFDDPEEDRPWRRSRDAAGGGRACKVQIARGNWPAGRRDLNFRGILESGIRGGTTGALRAFAIIKVDEFRGRLQREREPHWPKNNQFAAVAVDG